MGRLKTALSRLKLKYPRVAYAVRYFLPHHVKNRKRWSGKRVEEVFTTIYEKKMWAHTESRSGGGSTLKATENIRRELPRILESLGVESMLDAPCGDFYWMRLVDLGSIHYIGGDIVKSLVDNLQEEFGSAVRSFIHLDLISDPLPQMDVLFCRDCIQHLSPKLALKVIGNFKRSDCTYLITTSFPEMTRNINGFTGGTNTFNLCKPPFNFPEPLEKIEDHGSGGPAYRRILGVWRKSDLL